jgi:hypothetical protein
MSSTLECAIKRSVWHWINIGWRPMPTSLKRSTASIARTRCWNTRSQASEPAADATYRTSALVSRAKKRFAVRRIIGGGDLWITEFILTYDGKPSYAVSIMEFKGDKVARETQYFADPFPAPASRAQWVERMDT